MGFNEWSTGKKVAGTTDVTITDSNGKIINEGKTSVDCGSVYILLKV